MDPPSRREERALGTPLTLTAFEAVNCVRAFQALVSGRQGADALLHSDAHARGLSGKGREARRRDIDPLTREAGQPRRQLADGGVGEATERATGRVGRTFCKGRSAFRASEGDGKNVNSIGPGACKLNADLRSHQ